jgi:hypothetical protein
MSISSYFSRQEVLGHDRAIGVTSAKAAGAELGEVRAIGTPARAARRGPCGPVIASISTGRLSPLGRGP